MMGRISFLIALFSVLGFYKSLLPAFSGFWDFGIEFSAFWCFSKFCNALVLLLVLFSVFKILRFSWHCKLSKALSMSCANGDQFVKKLALTPWRTRMPWVSGKGNRDGRLNEEIDEGLSSNSGFRKERCDHVVRGENEVEVCCDEDQVFDVMSLRKMVKFQRRRANAAERELEKERMAAGSAADEAMAMILRLQNEKSSLQMQLNQLQRVVEERELHDESVIQSLEWIVMSHEYERSLLEDKLRIFREKLRLYVKDEEWDEFDFACLTSSASPSSCDESTFDDELIRCPELESSRL